MSGEVDSLPPSTPIPQTSSLSPNPLEVYAVFCDGIFQNSVNRIFANFAGAMAQKYQRIHLLFQSTGGTVSDGVCLYNFFKNLPVDLIIYNVGSIQSIATIAYLGAKKRKTTANATFMIHRTTAPSVPAMSGKLKKFTEMVTLDDQRTETILRSFVTLNKKQWSDLNNHDLTFSGSDAVKLGFADEIGEFSPPPGTQIFNV